MTQSTPRPPRGAGIHVAIIMDGNGRWAAARGRPRSYGHRAGARSARRVVEAAPDLGVGILSLYAFSADNWRRPAAEVRSLMRLFKAYLRTESRECAERGIRMEIIGRRDRLAPEVVREVEAAEALTAPGDRFRLRIALDYSAREAILSAAARMAHEGPPGRDAFARLLGEATHAAGPAPDVDLLIRTGGEKRLSDFMLWESAYAELVFLDCLWPDFGAAELETAVREYHGRERRFGALPPKAPSRPRRPRRAAALR